MADKYDKQSTARLPLVESVIIIAIFAVVSVVIMQMYLSANRIQKKAVNISKATILAENKAEELKNGSVDLQTRYYDSDWKELAGSQDPAKKAHFVMECTVTEEGKGAGGALVVYRITVTDKNGEELIALDADNVSLAY
ncbi:MAG: hypothetical protein J6Y89_06820 [Lachnospiraceae bacterium]|nr:hypothetical protein [Lachnospiraceae bacterium]